MKVFGDSLPSRRFGDGARMLAKEISVKRYVVRLSGGERQQLETLVTGAPAAEGTDIVEGRCLGGR